MPQEPLCQYFFQGQGDFFIQIPSPEAAAEAKWPFTSVEYCQNSLRHHHILYHDP